ncbi:latexin [Heptranchias perlo]|uniref:latexin n=1 Tax=Heptranchias perlo TaxID=212740 RepID=UPI00355A52B9
MYSVLCFIVCFLPLLYGMPKTTNRLDLPVTAVEIPKAARLAQQATSVAVHYLNYHRGSPNTVYGLHKLKKVYIEVISNIGHKYHLEFEVKNDVGTSNVTGICIANVLFHNKKQNPDTALKCKLKDLKKDSFKKDNKFYLNLKKQKDPVVGYNIPDNFGFVDHKMMPIWHLAKVSASSIIWEKSTEVMRYNVVRIQKVNQWIRTDRFLQFTYTVLFHELPTQEIITCTMWVTWHPKQPLTVKYFCLSSPSESFSKESEFGRLEGSGSERMEGSGSERMEGSGSERMEGSGSERMEGSGSERMEGSGSERMEGSGSERMEGSGSERMEGSGSERMEGSGSERMEGSGSERMEGSGSERMEGSGSERMEGSGSERMEGSGSERMEGSGSERMEGSGSERMEGSGSERLEGSAMEGFSMN